MSAEWVAIVILFGLYAWLLLANGFHWSWHVWEHRKNMKQERDLAYWLDNEMETERPMMRAERRQE